MRLMRLDRGERGEGRRRVAEVRGRGTRRERRRVEEGNRVGARRHGG
jgi:hypothetical protein